MSTTSSERKARPSQSASHRHSASLQQPVQANSDPQTYPPSPEVDRKHKRPLSDRSADSKMHRYHRGRGKDTHSTTSSRRDSSRRRRTPSNDRSHSEDGSRSSALPRFTASRIGKRVRRRPQRWDGDALDAVRAHRVGMSRVKDEALVSDGESTMSLNSSSSDMLAPYVDSPFADLKKAIAASDLQPSRREMVDWFHSWQLRAVSKQAAQQKALHVFLKRRLRKRTTRSPEHDRMEQEALRNARLAVDQQNEKQNGRGTTEDLPADFDFVNENFIVPNKIRLPLEAYMPRRMAANGTSMGCGELLEMVPTAPQLPSDMHNGHNQKDDKWLALPTVAVSAQWNSRKSNSRRRAVQSSNEPVTHNKIEDPVRS
ncbi:hypothetical protein BWQ96_02123 [Gracilariopsis chorda]|uniref:Uncharacterized protein n=1 Tax=Gracilariopsis chorda TaxID=448386 RepID=A0A2V3J188_9FLOR|nr:hypothetical protein BWQ96_02123 [Gracilariopsis chorda]|eukprot:PXF48171.1 hypothetical protein BWQ96_02123 [Gracilariopsis chorda]